MNIARMGLRDGAVLCQRRFSLFSNITKKTQEAIDKTKSAAEELQKGAAPSAETVDRVKQQAAAATSVLSDKVSQAQELAKGTVQELFGTAKKEASKPAGEGASAATGEAHHQEGQSSSSQQQQETSSSSSSDDAGSSGPSFGERFRSVAVGALQEMRAALLPEQPSASALLGASAKAADIQTATTSELAAVTPPPESAWQKQWREMRDKLGGHPFFQSLEGITKNRVFGAGRDVADAVRERWETSDSPLVHRIQDATDSLFAEGEAAQALREIRARDPGFDMVRFLQHLKADVPVVIGAYLRGEEETIKAHCSPEMIERLTGIMKAQTAAGMIPDPTLLDTSEVELVDLKVLDDSPVIVAQFTCQQINCTRDTHGNVVEGAPDEVHRVYYYWALQQEASGYVGEDGKHHPPRWQLREMLIRGMHHLL